MKVTALNVSIKSWGLYNDQEIFLVKWENSDGSYVEFTNYGATIVSVVVPDAGGDLSQVVLGFNKFEAYLADTCYIGSTVGRFANRISRARFTLDDREVLLEANDNLNSNHGGFSGFNSKVFNIDITSDAVIFSLISEDEEGGYPGNLELKVKYTWTESYELSITYQAISDKKTIANFTNHSYFNLSGINNNITDHSLLVNAGKMLEMREDYLPSGKVIPCGAGRFDSDKLSDKLVMNDGRLTGVNNYYILDRRPGPGELQHACTLKEETTGRSLEVFTSYPGLMVYTGDYLSSNFPGNRNAALTEFGGICLECQHYPDSPNQPGFPQAILEPAELYEEVILFKFFYNN
ncbi:aldose epimerase family protein [Desertivirga xinjiangensis]|uniref:aldose epimerase family protein n=1 Tax=Desertivirga xinjiangensis TaxID=539206 RepID=UPI00210D526A|nr:aldose epimerase family protein [Pedobacter xinjiangensis]